MADQATTTTKSAAATLTAVRARLSSIMKMAHSLNRNAAGSRSFADCLRAAWAWVKKVAKSPLAKALRKGGHISLADTIASPIMRRHGRRAFSGGRGSAVYLTSKIGG